VSRATELFWSRGCEARSAGRCSSATAGHDLAEEVPEDVAGVVLPFLGAKVRTP